MTNKPIFKAPCNITKNNVIEIQENHHPKRKYPYTCICVRYKCGKIKWKVKKYKKTK